ncbi:hypothetical protein ACI2IX_20175 [Leifsonia aquatica]|uniref:hypothetical protein n=1 Tax=Leifsonia aquatica TaxID=144185 RepID=UPI00384B5071
MDEHTTYPFHQALAAELRIAQAVARLSAPKLELLTGIRKDTVRRILSGKRPVTVVELAQLSFALGVEDTNLIARAHASAQLTSTAYPGA